MRKYTRGEFLGLGAMLAGAAALTKLPFSRAMAQPRQAPVAPETPDFILVGGRVLTMESDVPRAEAFAVKGGRFVAVGSNADVRNLATRTTPVVDAAGMTVVPGFIDCHCHPRGVTEL
jgi:adenine deaminase